METAFKNPKIPESINTTTTTGNFTVKRRPPPFTPSPWHATLLLLLLLSHFSRVRLCATPQTAAHQAPPSLGFSRQEHWSGLPFPSPVPESESEVAQSCPTLRDSMDCSLPGSSIHGIFQARVLEWGAIAFSDTHLYRHYFHFSTEETGDDVEFLSFQNTTISTLSRYNCA